jgi:hypothetical protein
MAMNASTTRSMSTGSARRLAVGHRSRRGQSLGIMLGVWTACGPIQADGEGIVRGRGVPKWGKEEGGHRNR